MTEIVLFHSVLGIRAGITDAAARFRAAGHTVHTPDLYEGRSFDTYDEAFAFLASIGGIPELITRTQASVEHLPEDVVYAGFSNGGASVLLLTATRPGARGALLFHAAMPLTAFEMDFTWPHGVPAQVHYATGDPYREEAGITGLAAEVRAAGAPFDQYDYEGTGHLFSDPELPEEYDKESAELMFSRALEFLERVG
ncbi:dienelactone hydrolase family protein [Streptomyces sp. NPDC048172]|uniref:dienelactone hydrolase family protein n=1 Tax=Streptomyces sp. NPDC048172 TaxID=3365505 RepID=UPI00371D6EAF